MEVLLVQIYVKPEYLEEFTAATLMNAQNSVQEPGVIRFDVLQQPDDPTHFVLVEVYRDAEASLKHKESAHYFAWRDRAADMMAEPRKGTRMQALFPDEDQW